MLYLCVLSITVSLLLYAIMCWLFTVTCTDLLHYVPSLFSPRRTPGGHTTTDTSASEDDLTFSGNYQPKYNPPNDNMAALKEKKRQKNETNPLPDAYVNVTMMGTGPCTQSGVWAGLHIV